MPQAMSTDRRAQRLDKSSRDKDCQVARVSTDAIHGHRLDEQGNLADQIAREGDACRDPGALRHHEPGGSPVDYGIPGPVETTVPIAVRGEDDELDGSEERGDARTGADRVGEIGGCLQAPGEGPRGATARRRG